MSVRISVLSFWNCTLFSHSLFKGVSPNAVGAGTAWGLYFFGYNFLKASMIDAKNVKNLSAAEHLLAGTIAGRYDQP